MTLILAHRGNTAGKTMLENNFDYLLDAADFGCGVETDLRRATDTGELIISHDPAKYDFDLDARRILAELQDTFIALNIKEPGLCQDLFRIKPYLNGFVFDFELCCSNPEIEILEYQAAGYKIARRYSDRGEFPRGESDFVWFDEMDQSGSLDIQQIDLSKTIYVSPELHGRSVLESRSDEFFGICTDYCDFYLEE